MTKSGGSYPAPHYHVVVVAVVVAVVDGVLGVAMIETSPLVLLLILIPIPTPLTLVLALVLVVQLV